MSPIYVGRRKCSVALVSFVKGTGEFIINEKAGFNYFQQDPFAIQTVVAPLKLINLEKKYDIICLVRGGGICAQAEAIRLGIARALCSLELAVPISPEYIKDVKQAGQNKSSIIAASLTKDVPLEKEQPPHPFREENSEKPQGNATIEKNSIRSILKEHGYLRRDSRIKERRKYGLKKARKAEQYTKR